MMKSMTSIKTHIGIFVLVFACMAGFIAIIAMMFALWSVLLDAEQMGVLMLCTFLSMFVLYGVFYGALRQFEISAFKRLVTSNSRLVPLTGRAQFDYFELEGRFGFLFGTIVFDNALVWRCESLSAFHRILKECRKMNPHFETIDC